MSRSAPNAFQKAGLIAFGLFCTIVLLESGLRLGGAYVDRQQAKSNQLSIDGEVKILCIGESTTALGGENAYPYLLQKILSEKLGDRPVKVINKGLIAKNSQDVLSELDDNLDKFSPDIVVSMVGINDRASDFPDEQRGLISRLSKVVRNLRTAKLVVLIRDHLRSRDGSLHAASLEEKEFSEDLSEVEDEEQVLIQQIALTRHVQEVLKDKLNKVSNEKQQQNLAKEMVLSRKRQGWLLFKLGRLYRSRGDFDAAYKMLGAAIQSDKNNYAFYYEFGLLFKEKEDFARAVALFSRAVELNPETILAKLELGKAYERMGDKEKTYKVFLSVADKGTKLVWAKVEIGNWFLENGHYQEAVTVFKIAIKANPDDFRVMRGLERSYENLGDKKQAQKYREMADSRVAFLNEYTDFTRTNYSVIAEKVAKRNIPLIAMQYPLREVRPLENALDEFDDVIFVENRSNFKSALAEGNFSDYFSDAFASDFGHCTRKGNYLIAYNVATTILEQQLLGGSAK